MDWCFERPGIMREFLGLFVCLCDCRTSKMCFKCPWEEAAGILRSYHAFGHSSALLTLHERIYCTNAMFGIIASVLSWQQRCYQQPKEVQYHCHPVKAFFHELTLKYFSLEDVLPTLIICDWCIGWGWKADKSICLEICFCRMLSFSKLSIFFPPVDGCIKIES